MKRSHTLFLIAPIITFFSSCTGSKEMMSEDIAEFKLSDTLAIQLHELMICSEEPRLFVGFDTIYTDSRCPKDAQCIWEGNAEAGLSVTYGKELETIKLNSNPTSGSTVVSAFGYQFSYVNLLPEPGQNGSDNNPRLFLVVKKD